MFRKQKAAQSSSYFVSHSIVGQSQPRRRKGKLITAVLLVAVIGVSLYHFVHGTNTTAAKASNAVIAKTTPKPSICATNSITQNLIVSISQRHMWACGGSVQLYDNAVITGMESLPADLTPVGTYHIYAKTTGVVLRGSDSTGSWNDPVSYWMPFLDNQYGTYGFHDATWRKNSDFGTISPNSTNASHGCVEMPLAAAKWLYGWANVGATVTIES